MNFYKNKFCYQRSRKKTEIYDDDDDSVEYYDICKYYIIFISMLEQYAYI